MKLGLVLGLQLQLWLCGRK